jgi:hypothetical protein
LEEDLREFLDAVCRTEGGGLVILTSWFPFVDLSPFLEESFRQLELDRLTSDEGAEVLRRLGVKGTHSERREVSRRLEGHPLALRVFAGALAIQPHADSTRLWKAVFHQAHLKETDPLERRLKHLLTFYEKQMPAEQRMLLGIISLIRSPVPEATVFELACGLGRAKALFEGTGDLSLRHELRRLRADRFLTLEEEQVETGIGYSCHPVLRDHFREVLLRQDRSVATDAATLLTEQPSSEEVTSIDELESVLTAIELLIEAGDFVQADQLYVSRLNTGR